MILALLFRPEWQLTDHQVSRVSSWRSFLSGKSITANGTVLHVEGSSEGSNPEHGKQPPSNIPGQTRTRDRQKTEEVSRRDDRTFLPRRCILLYQLKSGGRESPRMNLWKVVGRSAIVSCALRICSLSVSYLFRRGRINQKYGLRTLPYHKYAQTEAEPG